MGWGLRGLRMYSVCTYKECIMHVEDHELCGQMDCSRYPLKTVTIDSFPPWMSMLLLTSGGSLLSFSLTLARPCSFLWPVEFSKKEPVSFTSSLEEDWQLLLPLSWKSALTWKILCEDHQCVKKLGTVRGCMMKEKSCQFLDVAPILNGKAILDEVRHYDYMDQNKQTNKIKKKTDIPSLSCRIMRNNIYIASILNC